MNYPTLNDINRLTRIIEMLEKCDTSFETDIGKEFGNSMKASLDEVIKPYGRECIIKLRKQLKTT